MEDGARRKLPAWMSGVNNTKKVDQVDIEKRVQENASQSLSLSSRTKAKPLNKDPCSSRNSLDNEPKKRKRKKLNKVVEEESCITEVSETFVGKTKDNSGKRKTKNKIKKRIETIESPSRIEDDEELTIDDLLTIAQEYVERDENLRQQKLSDERNDRKTSSITEETRPVQSIIARSDDPTQDMLDLFFGSLLKKPVSDDKTWAEDKTFVKEVKEQSHDNNVNSVDFVPLTKKKSSLKDTVAMFLN